MPQVMPSPKVYDAVIVGSGAGGGMAAYVLTRAGAKCLMLEAGRWYDTAKESKMMEWNYNAPHRGASTPDKPFGYFDATVDGGWQVRGEPYTPAPGNEWMWWRARMLGGRTNHWGRISLRMGPYDFKPYSRDGKGFDWPITYDDLAPYYDKTEELIGVFGSHEGVENTPDGKFLPPPKPRCYELVVQKACQKLGIPCIPSRLSILTRLLNSKSRLFPNGLANSTGLVGKYLMDTVGADGSSGFLPVLMDLPPHNCDGVGGMHLYMPWWNYQKQLRNQLPFARGYHIEFGGGLDMPGPHFGYGTERFLGGGYGVELKRGVRKLFGAFVGFSCRGEMIPNKDSYCEIDEDTVDQWGIPVLKFHFKWTDDEILMAKHARETFREIIETAGGEVLRHFGPEDKWAISRGGEIIHEVGTTQMGDDRRKSVLNPYCQAWDCKNRSEERRVGKEGRSRRTRE